LQAVKRHIYKSASSFSKSQRDFIGFLDNGIDQPPD
jgi:hypothetical protein